MIVEDEKRLSPSEMSAEEARRSLIRFLGRQNLEDHEEIYEGLVHE
jgi:hypothetical protein